ncbi:MAG: hypothetical protein LBH43_16025 [Treponema sp.]|jgi:hypothetical protein|nr:hypothetical protein [Treponema sp.]
MSSSDINDGIGEIDENDENGNEAVPMEYRIIAEQLFSPENTGPRPVRDNAAAFARALGISADYAKCIETYKNSKDLENVLISFQNNVDLLIQKTWVEESDEDRKDDLHLRLPILVKKIEKENYRAALEEFGVILKELAYLFFGDQSRQNDFTEYTFRIDIQVGLFWWYGGILCSPPGLEWAKSADQGVLLAVLLLGICYLSNF